MRMFNLQAVNTARENAGKMYIKLAEYAPDEKLSRDDIRNLMFIVSDYMDELDSRKREIERGR